MGGGGGEASAEREAVDVLRVGARETDVCALLVLVLVDDEREKEKLALVETDRIECCESCEAERWRVKPRPSYGFLVCEGARCGMAGAATSESEVWFGGVK